MAIQSELATPLPVLQRPGAPGRVYAFTIFLSAFLLFLVQFLMGKYLLPWFGGTPSVWTTCLLFFQSMLLLGYVYSHAIVSRLAPRAQGRVHVMVLGAALAALVYGSSAWTSPVTPAIRESPVGMDQPTWTILAFLAAGLALPFFALSSTAPLLQSWFSRASGGASPYRLYAVSNLGAFLALGLYPFVVEPALSLRAQGWWWSAGFAVFALGCGWCAIQTAGSRSASARGEALATPHPQPAPHAPPPARWHSALWLSLAACGSVNLLAVTNQLCQGIAVVPFLWVLPLAIYVATFVICFENQRWYRREVFHIALGIALVCVAVLLFLGAAESVIVQAGVYSLALFACCMVCHGELVRLKPAPRHLTRFYLAVAVGGALGGFFVALAAPRIFDGFWEFQLGLWGAAGLTFVALFLDRQSWLYRAPRWVPVLLLVLTAQLPLVIVLTVGKLELLRDWRMLAVIVVGAALMLKVSVRKQREAPDRRATLRWTLTYSLAILTILGGVLFGSARLRPLVMVRNFYGVVAVVETSRDEPEWRGWGLRNGPILHGYQFIAEDKRRIPTSYYDEESAVGLVLRHFPRARDSSGRGRALRVGAVGLGVGTVAAYGRPGDYFRFYEINPAVIHFATEGPFTFLADSPAEVEVVLGDARLSMHRELQSAGSQELDVLVLDAFNGEAIPVHLLTREAFEIYLRHLRRPGGVIAVHISHQYLDLRPVVEAAARHFKLDSAWHRTRGRGHVGSPSSWVLVAERGGLLDHPKLRPFKTPPEDQPSLAFLWTDDRSNLFQHLRR